MDCGQPIEKYRQVEVMFGHTPKWCRSCCRHDGRVADDYMGGSFCTLCGRHW